MIGKNVFWRPLKKFPNLRKNISFRPLLPYLHSLRETVLGVVVLSTFCEWSGRFWEKLWNLSTNIIFFSFSKLFFGVVILAFSVHEDNIRSNFSPCYLLDEQIGRWKIEESSEIPIFCFLEQKCILWYFHIFHHTQGREHFPRKVSKEISNFHFFLNMEWKSFRSCPENCNLLVQSNIFWKNHWKE